MGYSRNEIKNLVEKNINKYKDDNNKKYVQLVGRHLIKFESLSFILNENFSIFDICTLMDVVLVTNLETGARQKRSYYELKAYTLEEYKNL
jgi:hypothetical protein